MKSRLLLPLPLFAKLLLGCSICLAAGQTVESQQLIVLNFQCQPLQELPCAATAAAPLLLFTKAMLFFKAMSCMDWHRLLLTNKHHKVVIWQYR
jgi:hypothetical protein